MNPPNAEQRLDLRGVPCPQNTARALMALEFMEVDGVLELWLDDGEPMENVPPALLLEGHRILAQERSGAHWLLWVACGAPCEGEE